MSPRFPSKPDREKIEKMKNAKEKDLLAITRRGGVLALHAAKEIVNRFRMETLESREKALRIVLNSLKASGQIYEKEIAKLKNQLAEVIIEKGLFDKSFFEIFLDQISNQRILGKATKEYFRQKSETKEEISSSILKQVVRTVSSLKEEAAKILLEQTKNGDDLIVIIEELEGKLQIAAWEKLWLIGIKIEDAVWIIGYVKSLSLKTWERLKKEKRIGELSKEDLFEISSYAHSSQVKKEATNEIWQNKRFDLDAEQLQKLERRINLITIEEHKKVKQWIDEQLVFADLSLAELMELLEKIVSPPLQLKLLEKIQKKTEEGIKEIEEEMKGYTIAAQKYSYAYKVKAEELNRLKRQKENIGARIRMIEKKLPKERNSNSRNQ